MVIDSSVELLRYKRTKQNSASFSPDSLQSGFTLLETLVVVVMISVMAAILAPGWLRFVEGNRLTVGADELYVGLRNAQSQAQFQKTAWQFSLRERSDQIEWAVHPKDISPADSEWEVLDSASIQIDGETTFASSGGIYYVRFDEDGNVQYRLGRITLSSKNAPDVKRCVIVSTLIGAMRKSKEQPTPRDGKLCY